MPYSISALFALPRSLAGLFFASKVVHLSTPSPPVVKYTPTRTTPIFLEPTRCLPSPTSSEPSELPYIIMYGLAALLLASVVFTIWSTIKDARRHSPPPEPDPETKPDEFNQWTPWLTVLFSNIAFYLSSTVTVISAPPKSLFPELMLYRLAMVLEEKIIDVLSIVHHLQIHGLQYLKIVMLAIIGHAVGFLIFLAHRRVLSFVRRHRLRVLYLIRDNWGPPFVVLFPGLLHLLHPCVSWIPWTYYYFLCRHGYLPDLWQIRRSLVLSLPSMQLRVVSMILVPLAIHCVTISIYTVIVLLRSLPSTVRAVAPEHHISYILVFTILDMAVYHLVAVVFFADFEVILMGPDVKHWIRHRESQIFTSTEARREVWEFYRLSRERHSNWRITQSKEFHKLTRLLWSTASTTWEALHWVQKLLIVAPAILFYGHYYIMPVVIPRVRNVQIWLRIEYEKYRRRQAVYRRYLQESVENRL